MKTKQNTITFIVVTIISLAAVISTYTLVNVDAWLLPRIICYALLILSIMGTVKSILDGRKSGGESGKFMLIFKPEEMRPLLEMAAWLVGFVLGIYLLGFYLSVFIFAFAYMKRCKRKWTTAIIFSIALSVLLYLMLRYGLAARLYEGLLFIKLRWR